MSHEEGEFHPRDAIAPAGKALAMSAAAGFLIASVRATLNRRNIGAFGTFTRYGSTVATFAAIGGSYEFSRIAAGNLRQQEDNYNEAIGGFIAGTVVGIRRGSLPAVVGCGAGLAILTSVFSYTGGQLRGAAGDPNEDEYERKEALRANKRRPIQETISELGEGRGIYGPGYAERRKERIKQNYGIDVPS